jgi:hypothetical protein
MSNPIKYSTGTESLALKKGNFYIGTGDVGKGPTSSTGYYNGISPPTGGYTIYLNKETGGPSIYTVANDTQLISLTNSIAGQSYTTANECLVYFAGQTDKMVLNRNYEGIVTDGLVLNLDAGFTPSYPKSGTTWYDVSVNTNNGTLTNGPTFNSDNGGSIVFDGTDDYVNFTTSPSNVITVSIWINLDNNGNFPIILAGSSSQYDSNKWDWSMFVFSTVFYIRGNSGPIGNINTPASTLVNVWTNWVLVRDDGTGTCRAYKNGTLFGTSNESSSINSTLSIGKGGNYYDGKVALTQIYNRALSADEVLQNYNAQKGRFGL